MIRHQPDILPARRRARSAAFTYIEVMFAMGIFALGVISVVSMFPAAAMIHRNALDEMLADQAENDLCSAIIARGFEVDEIGAVAADQPHYLDRTVFPVTNVDKSSVAAFTSEDAYVIHPLPSTYIKDDAAWNATSRMLPNPGLKFRHTGLPTGFDRASRFYWIPFVSRKVIVDPGTAHHPYTSSDNWRLFVALLRRSDREFDDANAWRYDETTDRGVGSVYVANVNDYVAADHAHRDGDWATDDPWIVPSLRCISVSRQNSTTFNITSTKTSNDDGNSDGRIGATDSLPDQLTLGDRFIDKWGNAYTVLDAQVGSPSTIIVAGTIRAHPGGTGTYPNRIWYARPIRPGQPSPLIRWINLETEGILP